MMKKITYLFDRKYNYFGKFCECRGTILITFVGGPILISVLAAILLVRYKRNVERTSAPFPQVIQDAAAEVTVFLKLQNKKFNIDRLKKRNNTGTH